MPQQESSTWCDNFLVQFLLGLEYCSTGNILEHLTVEILMRCNYMLHATNRYGSLIDLGNPVLAA